ncbi:exocyst complex component 2 [Bombus affinis]|uniref:Exocyst complex component 2 n=1 Tax=Bombus terrestris TaxID=30195 RepID=A0A9C6SQ51_BOMTE|nr:exocyst complex component 2 [Bombus terrestris]XP_048266395.1 exocyst complex component 2 [Bombus terrestris]XP_048266396.1 exocyst complex component 2 [Bombus terrestris]XP_050580434.1 exocyst complex component 2 [Bombus affinis]XP_050580435.1 exocyst complex component 2 [Bombus affinis]XP_050580436.1 exocyst complex component 2 [Bombus affinis]
MGPPPVVTGVSPKEGPPGTRVIVRGEFLGNKAQDLIGLTICGCDCFLSAEWKSSNKIIARSGPCKGRGDIIVTTRSGGPGTSTVQFRGYHETIGPMKESAVWVEEAPMQSFVWGRRTLSPTNYQQEDPLGLSVEGNDKKFPEDELMELFGEGSGDLTSEKFHPGWFLLQHHHATTFEDLRAGLAFLKRKVNSQKEGQLSFLKANVGSVMEQLDTITLLKEQFETDIKTYGSDPTEKLEKAIKQSMSEANKLFDDVLARRDRADATRNALSVMQRYKFLFCMPINIEKNIKRGNYDLVINDYTRVKNLFKNTEVEVFKKVLNEIDNRIVMLKAHLRNKLEEMPFSLEEHKKIIRNLVNLEAEGDPAWDAIVSHSNYLKKSITNCIQEHLEVDNSNGEDWNKAKSIQNSKQSKSNKNDGTNIPPEISCIETICDIIVEQLPDLWRLGQSYFTGQLHVAVDAEKQTPFKNLVLSSMEHAMEGLKDTCGDDLDAVWLLHILRRIRQMYASLIHLDLPNEALDIFGKFILNLRLECFHTLFKQTKANIATLYKKETWQIEYLNEDGGVTKVPYLFEEMVIEVAKRARDTVVACGPREEPLFANPAHHLLYYHSIQALFTTFTRYCLQRLAFSGCEAALDVDESSVSQLVGSPSGYKSKNNKQQGPTWEQYLLISLSNIRYTLNTILPRIRDALKDQGYPSLSDADGWGSDWTQLGTLDAAVLDAYLERRCDPLVGTIEPSMYLGGLEWDFETEPTHVRPYAQEILANLIAVHAEVRRVAPALLYRVLSHIVETVAEELARLMSCVTQFGPAGIVQARTDITLLRSALQSYSTPRAKDFFEEALVAIPKPVQKDDYARIDMLFVKVKTSMHLQLSCLAYDATNNTPTLIADPNRVTTV